MNQVELLKASLLNDEQKIEELTHWLKVMNRPNGWHYDLDHIWILSELEKAGIARGATIVDAGAGQGVMQYLLAARGYNVISLDFSPRRPPIRAKGIFNVKGEGDSDIAYQHPYMKFINYEHSGGLFKRFTLKNLYKLPQLPGRYYRLVRSYLAYLHERIIGRHGNFGLITYVRAPFHDVPLEQGIADAVISVSAIEHADIDLFESSIKSLMELLKPGAPLLLTTSATSEEKSTYDQKVEGWCFSRKALADYFPGSEIDFDAAGCVKSMLESLTFNKRLDPYYHNDPESPFYQKNFTTFPYLPVAVKLVR